MAQHPAEISVNRPALDQASILAVIVSLLADELKSLRHLSAHQTGSERWEASTLLGEVHGASEFEQQPLAIGADSLELLSLATRVATFSRSRAYSSSVISPRVPNRRNAHLPCAVRAPIATVARPHTLGSRYRVAMHRRMPSHSTRRTSMPRRNSMHICGN